VYSLGAMQNVALPLITDYQKVFALTKWFNDMW